MISITTTSTLLLGAIILYFSFHIPLDVYMMMRRDRSIELVDYNINSSDRMNLLMGLFSLGMWFSWMIFSIPSLYRSINDHLNVLIYSGPYAGVLQYVGASIAGIALFIAIWGRISRGKYAASWGLNETIPLITHGPYRFIRHPSYLFYMLMFVSLPLITRFIPLIFLVPGIWSYSIISRNEEKLLVEHFGDEYIKYQKVTGRFIPKWR